MAKDDIEQMLISELRFLEEYRQSFMQQHPNALVEREDPDVRRLIESMALFSAHTRLITLRNLQSTWRRLFASYFDFLLNPLPSMAIVQANITPRMVESRTFERGTEMKISTPSGKTGTFCTTADLKILPVTMEKMEIIPIPGGRRLSLHMRSRLPRIDSVGVLRLYIHCADRYEAALRIHYQLRAHCKRAFVVYDNDVNHDTTGPDCPITFGSYFDEPYETDPSNALEQARSFFHFPEQDLYINVQVPRHPQSWSRIALVFDLDDTWEHDSTLVMESFQLFTVPVVNVKRGNSLPIICDGTQEAYAIRYIDPAMDLSLQSVRGVFRITDEGMKPLRPAVLSTGDSEDTYEIEERQDDLRSGHFLIVRMPRALVAPARFVVDGWWHQPSFSREAVGRLQVTVPTRNLEGLRLQPLSDVRPFDDNMLSRDSTSLLQLLSLRMKPTLNRSELMQVLGMLGTMRNPSFRRQVERIRDSRVELAPDSTPGSLGIRHIYTVTLDRYDASEEALVWTFLTRLRDILDAWNSEASVQLTASTGGSPLTVSLQ